jgi:hypothetical protein
VRVGLALLDVQLQEGLDLDPARDLHPLLAVREVQVLLFSDPLPVLSLAIRALVADLVCLDDLLDGLRLFA